MDFNIVIQLTVSGALVGLIYTMLAYGFQLTYSTSRSVNFGQGELVMMSAYFTFTLLNYKIPYYLCVPFGILFGACLGLFVERMGVRYALEQKTEGWILNTIILGLFAMSCAENIWGKDDHPFPAAITMEPFHIFKDVVIASSEVCIVFGALLCMLIIEVFKRKTILGKAVVAVALNRESAELIGACARRIIAISYALSGGVAAFAGILIAPTSSVGVTMASAIILKGFSVAVVAGLDSGFGVVAVGAILGILENLTSFYIGSGWREAPGLILLILALALKPTGIFGKNQIYKV